MLLITVIMIHFFSQLHLTGALSFKPEFLITKFQYLGTAEGVSIYDILDFLFCFLDSYVLSL